MENKNVLTYKGKMLLRKGNEIYYGNPGEKYMVLFRITENEKLKDYDKQMKQLDKKMASLQAQQAAAQAELAQKIAKQQAEMAANGIKEDFSGSYAASASELEWLAATIQAEADGESYTGKLAVGTVIMNRVKSSVFPNSIVGVITQTNQFALQLPCTRAFGYHKKFSHTIFRFLL